MTITVLQFGYERQKYSGSYEFTVTSELDLDFRKYMARKLQGILPAVMVPHPAEALPLDISLDDIEGDVVAGISGVTHHGTLELDMLWVDEPMRGSGIGRRLVQMAEEIAIQRGCDRARLMVASGVDFYVGMGYTITGTVQQVPDQNAFRSGQIRGTGQSLYWLCKDLR